VQNLSAVVAFNVATPEGRYTFLVGAKLYDFVARGALDIGDLLFELLQHALLPLIEVE
jgi:hypothetical protein